MINLKGKAIIVGGKNIIPIETSTEDTTISITRNGKYTTKPIVKAVFYSLKIKDGNNTYVGTSAFVLGFSIFAILTNNASSFS